MILRISSRTKLLALGVCAVFALGGTACGSSSSGSGGAGGGGTAGKDSGCAVGALGCECTSGGACDPGTTCDPAQKICVGAAGSGGAPDGGGGSAGASGAGGSGGSGAAGDAGDDADASSVKQSYRFVSNAITLPAHASDFAIDLDGNGSVDNQLGAVFAALASQGLDLQGEQTAVIASGKGLELFRLQASDPTLGDDPTSIVTLYRAVDTASPDFSGSGSFVVDGNQGTLDLAGVLSNGTFTSNPPPTGVPPGALPIHLAFLQDVKLIDAHVKFSASPTGLVQGQIDGAVTGNDINNVVIPNLAQYLDAIAKQNPCSSQCTSVKQMFDANNDGSITAQEVQSNSLLQALLAPDVDLLDASGNLDPNPNQASPDSVSVGIGFTAVKASFTP